MNFFSRKLQEHRAKQAELTKLKAEKQEAMRLEMNKYRDEFMDAFFKPNTREAKEINNSSDLEKMVQFLKPTNLTEDQRWRREGNFKEMAINFLNEEFESFQAGKNSNLFFLNQKTTKVYFDPNGISAYTMGLLQERSMDKLLKQLILCLVLKSNKMDIDSNSIILDKLNKFRNGSSEPTRDHLNDAFELITKDIKAKHNISNR